MDNFGRNIMEIAALLISVAFVALLLNRGTQTVNVIKAATSGFDQLLRTVTLQNSFGGGSY